MHQLQLTVGIMVAGLMSYGFVIYVNHGWRYIQVGTVGAVGTLYFYLLVTIY